MICVKIFAVLLISTVFNEIKALNDDEMKVKPVDALPSIVTKIVRRGLVPKRSRVVANSTETPGLEDTTTETTLNDTKVSNRINDDKSLDYRKLQCSLMNEKHVRFDDFQCKKDNGEYLHNVELIDGTRHKEEGVVINGQFMVRGFFFSKDDPNPHFHIYIKDSKGFHYYMVPVSEMLEGTQEYAIGDEDEEICSVRGDSCIDPKVLASMLG